MLALLPGEDETIVGAGRALREGRITCVGLVERCLAAIDEWEPKVKAWGVIDRSGALSQARRLDEDLQAGTDRGALHGIPIGVKDIIDVAGIPTRAGAGRWSSGPATSDADVVKFFRQRGAIILGKTVTTAYAFLDPPATRNPWNLNRTPGGSSSGSAAAVACGMCLAAIGTQTVGSLTRPAAFCGVASWKPMSGDRPGSSGIVALAPSLDAKGYMARSVKDLDLIKDELYHHVNFSPRPRGPDAAFRPDGVRLARLRGPFFDDRAEPSMQGAIDRAVDRLRQGGISVAEFELPGWFSNVPSAVRTILSTEAALIHRDHFNEDPSDYPPRIAALIEEGRNNLATEYVAATWLRGGHYDLFGRAEKQYDALICPAAPGPAPGPETTGDAVFNAPWNFFNMPTVSFPIGFSPEGMPLGMQVVGHEDDADWFFAIAIWCERMIQTIIESNPSKVRPSCPTSI